MVRFLSPHRVPCRSAATLCHKKETKENGKGKRRNDNRRRGGGRGGGHLRADSRSAEAGLGGTTAGVPRVQQAR